MCWWALTQSHTDPGYIVRWLPFNVNHNHTNCTFDNIQLVKLYFLWCISVKQQNNYRHVVDQPFNTARSQFTCWVAVDAWRHIASCSLIIVGSGDGLTPVRHQAITWIKTVVIWIRRNKRKLMNYKFRVFICHFTWACTKTERNSNGYTKSYNTIHNAEEK